MTDDLRMVLRGWFRAKASTSVILASLALGTGANALLYSVIDALLFRAPAGIARPGRLAQVFTTQFNGAARGASSYPDYLSLKNASAAFASLAVVDDSHQKVARLDGTAHRVRVAAVSGEFFAMLGMQASAGRLLTPHDASSDGRAAVISTRLWRMFGSPSGAVGSELSVGGDTYRIVGIAPVRFNGLQLARVCDVWIPLPLSAAAAGRGDRRLAIIGRLRPDVDLAAAGTDVGRVSEQLAREHPDTNRGTRSGADEPRLMSVARYSWIDAAVRQRVLLAGAVVMGATGLLLLSACVNAASLLLFRSAGRRREVAVKVALGATRRLLVRQGVVDSLLLSLTGAALGLLLAYWTASALPALFAPEQAEMLDTSLNGRLVATAVALAAVAGLVFAIAPAWHVMETSDVQALRADASALGERTGTAPLRGGIVIAQIGLSTVLIVVSAILIRAVSIALDGDLGPGGRGYAIASLRFPGDLEGRPLEGLAYQRDAVESVRQLEGARAVGWVSTLPVGRSPSQTFTVETRPGVAESVDAEVVVASASYFSVLHLAVIEGRNFTFDDRPLSQPVAIVNDVFAQRYLFPLAMGRRLVDADGREVEVVGVVKSPRYRALQEAPEPTVYFPLSQQDYRGPIHLIVRAEDAEAMLAPLRAALEAAGRPQIFRMLTFNQHLSEALTLDRLATTLVSACAVAALVLATIGMYGVVADAVRRRTPEIGLRIALGASRPQILRLVFGEGAHLAAGGVLVGIGASLLLQRIGATYVHAFPAVDAGGLAVVPLIVALVVGAAAALPARRALRIDPTVAFRAE